jgi:hypothetical protein
MCRNILTPTGWYSKLDGVEEDIVTESVEEYIKRPLRYNQIDGLGEVFVGISFLVWPLFDYIRTLAPEDSAWHWRYTSAIFALALLAFVVAGSAVLRRRITYRRTGYVKYRSLRLKTALISVASMCVAMVVALLLARWHVLLHGHGIELLGGLAMAALYGFATKLDHLWRWIIAAVLAFGPFTVDLMLLQTRGRDDLSAGVIGVCWLVSGAITFCLYLRHTQPTQDAE